jgi:hypothetical protein
MCGLYYVWHGTCFGPRGTRYASARTSAKIVGIWPLVGGENAVEKEANAID